jgi:hypothetical protein
MVLQLCGRVSRRLCFSSSDKDTELLKNLIPIGMGFFMLSPENFDSFMDLSRINTKTSGVKKLNIKSILNLFKNSLKFILNE